MLWTRKTISLLLTILAVSGLLVYQQTSSTDVSSDESGVATTTQADQPKAVTVLGTTTQPDALSSSGRVTAEQSVQVAGEISGVITNVSVDVGDRVTAGQTIARVSDVGQQAGLRKAQANLRSQEARLEELRAGTRSQEQANAEIAVRQARESVQQAQFDLFNTDLQAYVASGESAARSGSLTAPVISGSYQSDQSGRYEIRLYKSGSKSGYSFRYSGLESGVGPVSTDTPQPLGTRGLYIEFPENFARNQLLRWEVPVPNRRSPQFQQAQNNLTQSRNRLREAQNNLSLTESGARSEQISQQEAQVSASEASLDSAENQLAKTRITAPFSGTVQSVPVSVGSYRGAGQAVAELINTERLFVETSLSPENAKGINIGDSVYINGDIPAVVHAKTPAVSDIGSISAELRLTQPQQSNLTPGEYVDITFSDRQPPAGDQRGDFRYVPLSAVSTQADASYILVVNDDSRVQEVPVTSGSVTGELVAVRGDIPDQPIIANVDTVMPGEVVEITSERRE
jgi:RND family efflux transporter MFP subunit